MTGHFAAARGVAPFEVTNLVLQGPNGLVVEIAQAKYFGVGGGELATNGIEFLAQERHVSVGGVEFCTQRLRDVVVPPGGIFRQKQSIDGSGALDLGLTKRAVLAERCRQVMLGPRRAQVAGKALVGYSTDHVVVRPWPGGITVRVRGGRGGAHRGLVGGMGCRHGMLG